MSILIDTSKCIGCGLCTEACPGNLIKVKKENNSDAKATIKCPDDCWGCTSCVKTCPRQAIKFYLGADIGGRGSTMIVKTRDAINIWQIETSSGEIKTIEVNPKDANKY